MPFALAPAQFGGDVRGVFKLQIHTLAAFLDLLRSHGAGAEIRRGRGLNDHVAAFRAGEHRLAQFGAGNDGHELHARGRGQGDGAGDERHGRPPVARGLGDGKAHLARGAVGQKAHRVEHLARGAGGDEQTAASKVLFGAKGVFDGLQNGGRLLHAPHVLIAAGEVAAGGAAEARAPGTQAFDVFLCGGVLPHGGVHRRGQQHGAAHGQIGGGEQIVGDAGSKLGEDVGRGGRDHEQIRPLGKGDVGDLVAGGKEVGMDAVPRERFQRQGGDEPAGMLRHHDAHLRAPLFQQTDEFRRAIGGDAARHAQHDPLTAQHVLLLRVFIPLLPRNPPAPCADRGNR